MNPLDGFGGGAKDASPADVLPAPDDAGAILDADATVDAHVTVDATADADADADAAAELPGPVGYWDFEVSGGNILVDRSGHGHDGLIIDTPSKVPGVVGNALSFTSYTQRVEFSSLNGANMPRAGTLSLWLKCSFSGVPGAADIFFGSFANTSQIRLTVPKDSTMLQASFVSPLPDGGTENVFLVKSGARTPNVWQHVVIVWDSDNEVGDFYVDGFRWAAPWAKSGWSPSGQEFNIARHIQGIIDEVRLYDRAFGQTDVLRIP